MNFLNKLWNRLLNEEKGQGMTEYGLILGLIAIAAVGALIFLGGEINTLFTNIVDQFRQINQ
jgi:pilus assembly protein Flp/PilA